MIIRSLLLLLPMSIWAGLIISKRLSSREITASFLGTVWVFHVTLMINIIVLNLGSWSILVNDSLFYGVPMDWIISQSIVAGALIPFTRSLNWSIGVRLFLQSLFIVMMYYFGDVILLGDYAEWSVLSIIVLSSFPALFLSDWTANDSYIYGRSFLQSLSWGFLLFWMFPSTVFYLTSDSWASFLDRGIIANSFYLLPLLIPIFLIASALYQFAVEGDGTGFPYDAPKRLVTGGIYSYISNPMQLGICLGMSWWGIVVDSVFVFVSALVALCLFVVFKDVCDGSCAIGRDSAEWKKYQRITPKWWPRLFVK
ncbi:MAG: hypothetical protein OEW99_01055 [Gammaproteobacteria bacterium]|nr:hypothetical protein [Gammaproteobacteria bacterium]